MIKQRPITTKTASASLTVSEMGDIVVDSSSATTVTLPAPSPGLWYRFSNANSGLVTISYNSSTITTLKQAEQCLCLSNGTSGWFFSKGGGAMTKAEIEDVLTGIISTHKHILSGSAAPTNSTAAGFVGQFYLETTTPTLYQCTAISGSTYTWTQIGGGSGSYTLPQATESALGGIKASAKTTETNEVKIDASTGKLYAQAPDEATNGLPAGGNAGQFPYKKSATDYDMGWMGVLPKIDIPPSSPSNYDDEFEGSSLNAKWSWIAQNGCVASVDGQLHLSSPTTSTSVAYLLEAAPTGNFIVMTKHTMLAPFANYLGGGIAFYNSATDKSVVFINQNRATNYGQHLGAYRYTTCSGAYTSVTIGYTSHQQAKYLRGRFDGTNIYLEASNDGVNWLTIYTEALSTHLGAITHIGVVSYRISSTDKVLNTFDWFRVTQ